MQQVEPNHKRVLATVGFRINQLQLRSGQCGAVRPSEPARLTRRRWQHEVVDHSSASDRLVTTHRSRRRFSQRATGLPRNLTFTHAVEKGSAGDSRRSGLQPLTGASSQLNDCLRGQATEAADPELMHARSTTAPEIRYLLPRSGGCIATSAQLGHPTAGAPTLKPASCETRWRIDSRR